MRIPKWKGQRHGIGTWLPGFGRYKVGSQGRRKYLMGVQFVLKILREKEYIRQSEEE